MRLYFIVMSKISLALFALLLVSCETTPTIEKQPPEIEKPKLSKEEQEQKSLEKFNEMLEMTAGVYRTTIIDKLEDGYYTIIKEYPDAYLAEESYYRLIIMNLEDYYPSRVEKAEELYLEYFEKYPNPQLDNAINDIMARFYYKKGSWEKLATFCVPFMKQYVRTKELPTPLYMFFYSEAKFKLNEFEEAKRGYNILISKFPDSREAEIGKARIDLMQKESLVEQN